MAAPLFAQLTLLQLIGNRSEEADVERKCVYGREDRNRGEPSRVPDPELIEDVGIGEGQIRDDKIRKQESADMGA